MSRPAEPEPSSARERLLHIAAELGLEAEPSPAARGETEAWVARPGIDDPTLEDLTGLPFVTIDEPQSKDLDQAVYVDAGENGATVWYAIADAAHFVRPGSALFEQALERGSTYYLPDLVFPMLPRELSEGLVSINPQVDRRALVFEIALDRDGEVTGTRLHRARVRSRCKTSYQAVQAYYDGAPPPAADPAIARGLDDLRTVGRLRLARAAERDVVQVERREIAVATSGGGARFVAMADPRHESDRYNEQISLLCNVEGARFLSDGDAHATQGIFRFHQPPDEQHLESLRRQIQAIVRHRRIDPERWAWRRGAESLADYLARLPHADADPQLGRLARSLHRQALLAAGRAGFAPVPGVHHGVGAEAYARFTAPMREIVGVFVHKETWEKLGRATPGDPAADEALRDRVVVAAERSRQFQRRLDQETNRLVLDQLFGDDLARTEPPWRPATVLGIARDRLYAQLDEPPIDVKIYFLHLAEQLGGRIEAGRDGVSVRAGGRHFLAVGDGLDLRVEGVDRSRDRWRLSVRRLDDEPR